MSTGGIPEGLFDDLSSGPLEDGIRPPSVEDPAAGLRMTEKHPVKSKTMGFSCVFYKKNTFLGCFSGLDRFQKVRPKISNSLGLRFEFKSVFSKRSEFENSVFQVFSNLKNSPGVELKTKGIGSLFEPETRPRHFFKNPKKGLRMMKTEGFSSSFLGSGGQK